MPVSHREGSIGPGILLELLFEMGVGVGVGNCLLIPIGVVTEGIVRRWLFGTLTLALGCPFDVVPHPVLDLNKTG